MAEATEILGQAPNMGESFNDFSIIVEQILGSEQSSRDLIGHLSNALQILSGELLSYVQYEKTALEQETRTPVPELSRDISARTQIIGQPTPLISPRGTGFGEKLEAAPREISLLVKVAESLAIQLGDLASGLETSTPEIAESRCGSFAFDTQAEPTIKSLYDLHLKPAFLNMSKQLQSNAKKPAHVAAE